jgi:hypothetical protein
MGRNAAGLERRKAIRTNENGDLRVVGNTLVYTVDLTVDTSAYVSGDSLIDLEEVATALAVDGGTGILQELTLLDSDDEGVAIDFLFFSKTVALDAKNAAWALSGALMHDCLGIVRVTAGDYVDLGANQIATLGNLSIGLTNNDTTPGKSIYIGAIVLGTPTYAAATDLRLKITILRD